MFYLLTLLSDLTIFINNKYSIYQQLQRFNFSSFQFFSINFSTPIQSVDSAVESLDDSPSNIPKYNNGTQRYVIDEQLPNTSLNYGLFKFK